jgi:hypothetical protein
MQWACDVVSSDVSLSQSTRCALFATLSDFKSRTAKLGVVYDRVGLTTGAGKQSV